VDGQSVSESTSKKESFRSRDFCIKSCSQFKNLLHGNQKKKQTGSFRFLWPCIASKVWRERKDQQDATIRCLLLTSVSICFGHHYAHLQESKDRVTAYGLLLWFCWMWLVAVVGRCASTARILKCSAPQPLPTTSRRTRALHHMHGLCSPEDGHNDARNILRQKLIKI